MQELSTSIPSASNRCSEKPWAWMSLYSLLLSCPWLKPHYETWEQMSSRVELLSSLEKSEAAQFTFTLPKVHCLLNAVVGKLFKVFVAPFLKKQKQNLLTLLSDLAYIKSFCSRRALCDWLPHCWHSRFCTSKAWKCPNIDVIVFAQHVPLCKCHAAKIKVFLSFGIILPIMAAAVLPNYHGKHHCCMIMSCAQEGEKLCSASNLCLNRKR